MAFAFTCYGNDETIASTSIYATGINVSYTVPYGETLNLAGFPDSVRFTANPATNCSFTRWVYRLGSTTGTVQYSTSNPFTYSGTQDIFIRAEGTESSSGGGSDNEDPWTLDFYDYGVDVDYITGWSETYIRCKTVYCRAFTISDLGVLTLNTTGSVDTVGYISTSPDFDYKNGKPIDFIAVNDDGEDINCSVSCVAEEGKTYYIWYRGYSATTEGIAGINIDFDKIFSLSSSSYGTLSADVSEVITLKNLVLYRREVVFSDSGTAKFYTTGSNDTQAWLSTTSSWDDIKGRPSNYLAYSRTNGDDYDNFSISYNVTAGTTYYIWLRNTTTLDTGPTTLHIDVPKSDKITKWSWQASNGTATASITSTAYNAVVNKTAVTNFSYLVWNDLVDKVKEVLDYIGDTWSANYATYSNTKMTSSDKTLTASRFNSLRFNIGKHYSTGINDVAPNDDVLGRYFTTLTTCLNAWIDTI